MEDISRRSFLTGAVAVAGIAATAGLAGCAPQQTSEATAGSSAQAAPAGSGKTTIGQTPAWLGDAPQIEESDIVNTMETELLIVGAGNAGMAAAVLATDLGIDFVVAEKAGAVGATRNWYGAVNIPECAEAGKEVDTVKLNNVLRQAFGGKNDMRVVKVWLDESADTHAWVKQIMSDYGYEVSFDSDQGLGHGGVGIDMYVPPIQVNYNAREDCPEEYAKLKRNELFEDYINKQGHEVTYGFDLVKLTTDDAGAVTGAIFDTKEGYVHVKARNTLMTTGGYAANAEMLDSLNPILSKCLTASDWTPGNTGMGIKAALWAGAMKDPQSAAFVFDRGAVEPGTKAGWTQQSLENGEPMLPATGQFNPGSQPFLKMNLHGERFFNESANYDWAPHAAASQPGGVYLEVWDAGFAEDIERFHSLGCASLTRVMVNTVGMGTDGYLQEWIDKGIVVKADTLEELADGLKLEGTHKEAFLATIERYNELYDAQEDVDFGKEPYLLSQIRTAPFYGVTLGGTLLDTSDGLRINADMQVLDTNAEVIPGLYAAGNCGGSVFADGYYNLTHGMACGRALTFARHAVNHIAGTKA